MKVSKGLNVVHVALVMIGVAVVLFMYFGRDRLVERMEDASKIVKQKVGPRGRRGERGPRGASGGEFKMMGRLGEIGCLEKDNAGSGKCIATVNKLGGVALGKKGYDLEQIWQHQTDGTLRNMGRDKCLHVKKNEGVGADDLVMKGCSDDPTKWHYNRTMKLIPAGGNEDWGLGLGKNGEVGLVEAAKASQWTFFS